MKQRMKHRTMSPKILLNMAITSFFVPRPYRDKDMTTASLKPSWGTLPGRCLPPRGTRPCSGAGTGLAAGRGSQPQPAEKPSARLVFFYPYISGSARAFFPGGGQDGSQNGRFSTPSRKMAKEKEFFPVFKAGYLCRFFSPPGHYQEMHSKRRRLSAEPRLRAGGCARPLKCHSRLCPAIQGSRPACASVRRGHGVGIGKGRADIGHMPARRALGC